MKIVTAGERLFYLIRDKVLDALIFEGKKWSDLKGVLAGAGGKLEVEQYIKGAMAVHAMRKLLRYWDNEHSICSEVMGIKNVASFIREEIFIGLSNTIASELARAVIAAHSASGKRIGNEVKSSILRRTLRPRCYLCDQQLDTTALLGDPRFFTLEHLWPSSIGGDSVEENLIPACEKCQKVTQDTMSWEWFNMQNLVLPIEPSESALTSVDWKARYAIHFHQALCLAEQANLTLKDAFIQLGRIRANIGYRKTGAPITFFDLQTH